jgi:hypothetical protein
VTISAWPSAWTAASQPWLQVLVIAQPASTSIANTAKSPFESERADIRSSLTQA